MISSFEVVVQDQLHTSSFAGRVNVSYPRGATTVLSVQRDGSIQTRSQGTDGPFEQATITANGNLRYEPDAGGPCYIVLGDHLQAI